MTGSLRTLVVAVALFGSGGSFGAGFSFGENGTKALSQGGAFAAQADDLTALQHNPAGLAQLSGFRFLVEAQLLRHEMTFLRRDTNGQAPATAVQNSAGPFFLPNIGLGKDFEVFGRALTLAAGVYGPPAVGRYRYPTPNYARDTDGDYTEVPNKYSPQRYALSHSDIVILYPSLSAGVAVNDWLSVGLSAQYVYSRFALSQAVYSGLTPARQADEDPRYDSVVSVSLQGEPALTGVLGVLAQPHHQWSFGASFRPPVPLRARGRLSVELGELPRSLGAQVTGDRGTLALTLPMEAKLGLRFRPFPIVGMNFDVVYEGWQSIRQLALAPEDISIRMGTAEPAPLSELRITKAFHHTLGVRLGGEYASFDGWSVRAGALMEQSAAPDAYTNIDFAHFSRVFFTAGGSYPFGAVEIHLAGAYLPRQMKRVTRSEVRQVNTDPAIPGAVVGNGDYASGGFILSAGLRGRL